MNAMIRADMIDIIVDCTGHTAYNRLTSLSYKPAPIQINNFTVHGNTSGVTAMDYIFSDPIITPTGNKHNFSEEVIVLPKGFYTFRPNLDWPEITPLSIASSDIIFACVGDPARIAPATVLLWAKLLKMVPNSKIIFKHKKIGIAKNCEIWQNKFKEFGECAIFEGVDGGWGSNMDFYNRVHIVLDTLPMPGGSSIIIPLWMGVPVITMTGVNSSHRFGASIVTHAGFPEYVAENSEDYLRMVCSLATDTARLKSLRKSIRKTIKSSDMMNTKDRVKDVETAYRKVWLTWCKNQLR